METRAIQLRTHQKNIDRYKGLLKTKLSETERRSLEKFITCRSLRFVDSLFFHTALWTDHDKVRHHWSVRHAVSTRCVCLRR